MRVTLCVDALEPQPGGIGRYTWELCRGLAERPDISDLLFFGRNRLIEDPARLLRGERVRRGRGPARAVRAWRARKALRSTLVHGPNYFLPRSAPAGVITVHDLSVLRYPDAHPTARVQAFERLFTASVRRATHIIVDTETIRAELIAMLSVSPDLLTAVPLGVDHRFRPRGAEEVTPTLSQWDLSWRGYGLCVSTLEPRKKIAELIRAWQGLPRKVRDRHPLVLAGGPGWRNGELRGQIADAVREGWLRMLGFVDEAFLPKLYAGAALFIYPSIYEGFGLPPLEAMASGVPVMVSRQSCLHEVCGDAARDVDPEDISGFTDQIMESLLDSAWRAAAAARGLDRARQFTWDRCVEETVDVYTKVCAQLD